MADQIAKAFAGIPKKQTAQQIDLEDVTGKPVQPGAKKVRTVGKSKDSDFHKLTTYIPKKTRQAVAVRIANDGGGIELSVIVTKLLDAWASRSLEV